MSGRVRQPCRGIDGVLCCLRTTLAFGGRCKDCRRRWLRARAIQDMRELRALDGHFGPCEREPERREHQQEPERHEDPDGTVWTDFDVDAFVDPSLDDDASMRA